MGNQSGRDNPNHMFLDRHEVHALRSRLRAIPTLAPELAITETKQARIGEVGRSRKPARPSEQPLPYHVAAAEVIDQLHNALVGWVRAVCEQRALHYTGPTTTPGLARWLDRNIVALAMTEGAETALDEFADLVRTAERIVCPPHRDVIGVDADRYEQARKAVLNARGIAALARELGEEYRHLTQRRVHVLKEAGHIHPIPGPWDPRWPMLFRVGEVLDAHLAVPIRSRHAEAS